MAVENDYFPGVYSRKGYTCMPGEANDPPVKTENHQVSPLKKTTPDGEYWCLCPKNGVTQTYGKRVSFIESIIPGTVTLFDYNYDPIAIWNISEIRTLELIRNAEEEADYEKKHKLLVDILKEWRCDDSQ